MKKLLVVLLCLGLVGCANPRIVRLSPDTYMLSRRDHGGIFGNRARMKANVIREASEFAERQGKVAIPLAVNESPMWPLHFASIEYQFRVLDKNDPEAKRTHLIDKAGVTTGADVDLAIKIKNLNKLLSEGLITKGEFEEQKKKLLNNYTDK